MNVFIFYILSILHFIMKLLKIKIIKKVGKWVYHSTLQCTRSLGVVHHYGCDKFELNDKIMSSSYTKNGSNGDGLSAFIMYLYLRVSQYIF